MMPIPPILLRWAAIAALALAWGGFCWLQGAHHEALKAAKFEAATEALGRAQLAANQRTESAQRANLERINHDLNANLKTAGDHAVDNYLRRFPRWLCQPGAGGSAVPRLAAGQPGHDGQIGQQLAAGERATLGHCAEDAAIRNAWDAWRIANQIPVRE